MTTLDPACWVWPVPAELDLDPGAALYAWQDGRCAICAATPARLQEDHDHDTGMSRGYLCPSCNIHEARCADRLCRCTGYRQWPATAVLGVSMRYRGWLRVTTDELAKWQAERDPARRGR